MPIFEYKCKRCRKITERLCQVGEYPETIKCSSCGKVAKKILSRNGAVHTDGDVKWLESAKQTLPSDARHISTRSEHQKYLKNHNLACIG
jgi:putative FmdB family regulatory protein